MLCLLAKRPSSRGGPGSCPGLTVRNPKTKVLGQKGQWPEGLQALPGQEHFSSEGHRSILVGGWRRTVKGAYGGKRTMFLGLDDVQNALLGSSYVCHGLWDHSMELSLNWKTGSKWVLLFICLFVSPPHITSVPFEELTRSQLGILSLGNQYSKCPS